MGGTKDAWIENDYVSSTKYLQLNEDGNMIQHVTKWWMNPVNV